MNSVKKKIISDRANFFFEVLIVFLGLFLFLLIPRFILPMFIDLDSLFYGPLFYLLRALSIFLAIPLFLYLSITLLEPKKNETRKKDEIYPSIGHLNLYKISKNNFKYQFLQGILLLFLVFIPLDFLTYFLMPEMLDYTAKALSSNNTNLYLLLDNYIIFLLFVVVIQISVSFYEETLVRGFLAKRGGDYFLKMSAVIMTSFYFGLNHFAYFLNPISSEYPIIFPFIWFLQAFFVGIILSISVLRKKWIFPVIFAHAINNIISAHAVWNYVQGNNFLTIALYLYLPLLIGTIILFIWQFSRIREGLSIGYDELKNYFLKDNSIGESNSDKCVRIFFDLFFGFLIFLISLFIL